MPRVVPNQKEKFETEDLMKRHSREGEVSYYMDFLIDGQVTLFWPDQHEAATPFTKMKDLVFFDVRSNAGDSKNGLLLCL